MSNNYNVVVIPRESVNDQSGIVIEWLVSDSDKVEQHTAICSVELSKAVVEVEAPCSGWLYHIAREGDDVPVGEPIGVISATSERPTLEVKKSVAAEEPKITAKARRLISLHNLDLSLFAGIPIVKEKHVHALLETREADGELTTSSLGGTLEPATPIQRRVAATLSESLKTIPHSYQSIWIDAAKTRALVDNIAKKKAMMCSLSDVVVYTVASLAQTHRKINAAWHEESILLHDTVSVGFALNLENGDLVVPVIKDAPNKGLEQIVGEIRGFQKKAMRKRLSPEDLTGATVTVTSLIGTGAHQVLPIIVPGQAAIVAIGDVFELGGHSLHSLTVAFDHRVLNGVEAAAFLADLSGRLQRGKLDE